MSAASPTETRSLTRAEVSRTELLLAQCEAKQLTGLTDLLRFGIASSGNARGSYVAAAWLLNAARHSGLPTHPSYRRPDGTGFPHCDADWLEKQTAKSRGTQAGEAVPLRQEFLEAMAAVDATPHVAKLEPLGAGTLAARLAAHLRRREPSLLYFGDGGRDRFAILLAINEVSDQVFCCEIEESRARLKWFSAAELAAGAKQPGAILEMLSLSRHRESDAEKMEQPGRGQRVLYLDSDQGCALLQGAEGLTVVAYAALHGQAQRDLSSCNVASLSSIALPKGQRAMVTQAAAARVGSEGGEPAEADDVQTTLRSLAAHQLRTQKGSDFSFRGLGVQELRDLAVAAGMQAQPHILAEGAGAEPQVIAAFRAAARAALGRTIVNFWRPHLEQAGAGHHAVVVAYHAREDRFLIDDPAAFKMPCYWVETTTLVEAMATFDSTKGIEAYRGYLIVGGAGGDGSTPWDQEYSASVVIRRRP
jgi:hypothetical protein